MFIYFMLSIILNILVYLVDRSNQEKAQQNCVNSHVFSSCFFYSEYSSYKVRNLFEQKQCCRKCLIILSVNKICFSFSNLCLGAKREGGISSQTCKNTVVLKMCTFLTKQFTMSCSIICLTPNKVRQRLFLQTIHRLFRNRGMVRL